MVYTMNSTMPVCLSICLSVKRFASFLQFLSVCLSLSVRRRTRAVQVDVLEYHPDAFAYSAYKQHPLPAVLRVRTFVDVHEFAGRLSLTRKNIMLRDQHRCQ